MKHLAEIDVEAEERAAIQAEGALSGSSLDTVGVTSQSGGESRHNSTPQPATLRPKVLKRRNDRRNASWRGDWLDDLESLTALHREQVATKLEARSAELGAERFEEWQRSGLVAREEADRLASSEPRRSRWHDVRAAGKRRLFEKVAGCADTRRNVQGTCRAKCGHTFTLKVGCGSSMFCPECRQDNAQRIRLAFKRKRLGLLQVARRAGIVAIPHMRRRGGRWVSTYTVKNKKAREVGGFSERFITLTVPHVGSPAERVRVLRATWRRFWRTLADDIRPRLERRLAGVKIADCENGFRAKWDRKLGKHVAPDELSLWDLVAYFQVLEWTAGGDGKGHPHLHCWFFGPWLDWRTIRQHWSRAYAHVQGIKDHTPLLVTDVRRCDDDPSAELVKYLTKDWSDDDTQRVAPEVFAEVYAELDGKRRRQTSAGLAHWQLGKHVACPQCGHERERGHWAFVVVASPLPERKATPGTLEPMPPPDTERLATPATRSEELREAYELEQLDEWNHSLERRMLVARLAEAGINPERAN